MLRYYRIKRLIRNENLFQISCVLIFNLLMTKMQISPLQGGKSQSDECSQENENFYVYSSFSNGACL